MWQRPLCPEPPDTVLQDSPCPLSFQLHLFFSLLELMTVSGIADFPDAALSRGNAFLKGLRTNILVLICLRSLTIRKHRCCSCREDVVFRCC